MVAPLHGPENGLHIGAPVGVVFIEVAPGVTLPAFAVRA
jgi:hypothetical protein